MNKATETVKLWYDHNDDYKARKKIILGNLTDVRELPDKINESLEDDRPSVAWMWDDVVTNFLDDVDYDYLAEYWLEEWGHLVGNFQ